MSTMEYAGRLNLADFQDVTKKWKPSAIAADLLMHAGAVFAVYLLAAGRFDIPSVFTPLSFGLALAGFLCLFVSGFAILGVIFPRHYMRGVPLDYRLVFLGLAFSFVGGTCAFMVFVSALPAFSLGMWAFAYVLYWVRVLGITIGYHRFATHRAFKAGKVFVRCVFLSGALARQKEVGWWGTEHLIHHDRTEIESQDPHTPRQTPLKFFHGHIEWVWYSFQYPDSIWYAKQYSRGLKDDPLVQEQNKYCTPVMVLGFALPVLIFGPLGLWNGEEFSALNGLWEGFKAFSLGLLSFVLSHNVTMTVNSWSHTWGPKPFANIRPDGRDITGDSTDPWYLALFSAGESLQNIHHLMDSIACYWVKWYYVDFSGAIIVALERMGRPSWLTWAGLPYHLTTIGSPQRKFMQAHTVEKTVVVRGGP